MECLLTPKIRALLERRIKIGVPPVTAGMSFGFKPKTINAWLRTGMKDRAPEPPDAPKQVVELAKDWKTTAEHFYKHEMECRKFATMVCESEGAMVATLMKRLWAFAKVDPATTRFMFNKYTHAHELSAPIGRPGGADDSLLGGSRDSEGDDHVTILLPDNGRITVKAKIA